MLANGRWDLIRRLKGKFQYNLKWIYQRRQSILILTLCILFKKMCSVLVFSDNYYTYWTLVFNYLQSEDIVQLAETCSYIKNVNKHSKPTCVLLKNVAINCHAHLPEFVGWFI